MTFGDIIVLAVLGLIVGAILGKMYRDRKTGKSCGCGSCKGCSMGCSGENGCCCAAKEK